MKKNNFDSVLTEVHSVKDSISTEFQHDVTALCEHLRSLEKNAKGGPVPKPSLVKRTAIKSRRRNQTKAKKALVAKV